MLKSWCHEYHHSSQQTSVDKCGIRFYSGMKFKKIVQKRNGLGCFDVVALAKWKHTSGPCNLLAGWSDFKVAGDYAGALAVLFRTKRLFLDEALHAGSSICWLEGDSWLCFDSSDEVRKTAKDKFNAEFVCDFWSLSCGNGKSYNTLVSPCRNLSRWVTCLSLLQAWNGWKGTVSLNDGS